MSKNPKVAAIILAAGSGTRMGGEITKQRLVLFGESVLRRSVKAFLACDSVSEILVVCRDDEIEWAREELKNFSKVTSIVSGGKTRAESAKNGFNSISGDADYVAIHDGARCLVTPENINAVIDAAIKHSAATAGSYVTDTVKLLEEGFIGSTLQRERLFAAHTPQVFERELYSKAIAYNINDQSVTDDNMLIERLGVKVCPVDTGKHNIKLTTAEDIAYAEYILERRAAMSEIRIGHGYDVHRLTEGRRLILGGVNLPHDKGLLGHSDADVLTHAIMDALLGACALGDIGRLFPDSDNAYKDISSLVLLDKVAELISVKGYSIVNVDATLIIQRPKIAGYIDEMRGNIANILKIDQGRVNIKATTEEKLGFTGNEEGVAAHAVVSVKK